MNLTLICQSFDRSSILLQPWRHIYEISRRIVENGISVTIISNTEPTQPETEEIEGIRILRVGHPILKALLRKGELVKVIMKNDPDIVVWHGTPLSAVYLSGLRALNKPIVWIIDTDLGSLRVFSKVSMREICDPQNSSLWIQMLTALLPRFAIRRVANSDLISKIIVPSNYIGSRLRDIGVKADKIGVVPSTLEMDDLRNPSLSMSTDQFKKDAGFNGRDFIVTYFGSPSTLRGTDTVVRSVQQILPELENIRLLILSRRNLAKSTAEHEYFEDEERRLRRLARELRVEDHIEIIPGIQSKTRLREYLRASDVIALPFKIVFSDPPLSVLEAMSLGKPVVTTNVGSLAEIVQQGRGILVEPSQSDALAQAVIYLAEHQEERIRLGQNAQRFAANLPDWNLVALRFADLMKEICNKDSKSRFD